MSQEIGSQIPPPLLFELGAYPMGGLPKAILLVTSDADGSPRVAVLGAPELSVRDTSHLRFNVHQASTTCANLKRTGKGGFWHVLDAAAYCIRGNVSGSKGLSGSEGAGAEYESFELTVTSVLMDFTPEAPMVSGPTYKRI